MKTIFNISAVLVLAMGLNGCIVKHAQPYYVYAPEMHYGPGLKAQEPGSMRLPPANTVPRGFRPYAYTTLESSKAHLNPIRMDKSVLMKGQNLFNTYCIVCHGKYGEGDGLVSAMPGWPRPLFPRPPTLQSDKIRDYKDGEIFHIITMGQNLMPSYAEKLDNDERWAVVHYIRALHRAKHPTAEDMKKAEDYLEE
jgi:mono/diheme cytochrome c family protein